MPSRDVLVAPGVRIHAHMTGGDDGPVLVLLHGLGESSSTWDSVSEELRSRFRSVALDLRGHGLSSTPGDYSFEIMRDDVIAVLTELDLDGVTLVGHSMGGVVAYPVAQAHLERVQRLVVEDVSPPFAWSRPTPVRPEGELPFDWAVVTAIVRDLDDPEMRSWPGLAAIDVPTLIIGGGGTSHISQERLREVAALVPDCTLVTIPVGHDVHESEPIRFVESVTDWIHRRP